MALTSAIIVAPLFLIRYQQQKYHKLITPQNLALVVNNANAVAIAIKSNAKLQLFSLTHLTKSCKFWQPLDRDDDLGKNHQFLQKAKYARRQFYC